MRIKWLVCDLDGTMLDSARGLSDENISAVRELLDVGVGVVLASGRNDLFMTDYFYRLGVKLPVISCNGGLVRDFGSGEIIFRKNIPVAIAGELADFCLTKGQELLAYSSDTVYYSPDSSRINVFREYNRQVAKELRIPLREIRTAAQLPLDDLIKFFLWQASEEVAAHLDEKYSRSGRLTVVSSLQGALDVMADGISKGEALRCLAEKVGMNLAETVVLGDNYNDLSMFEVAGLPIAVANAEEEVKGAAKLITLSNDESGVAYAIRNYILPYI